MQIIAIDPGTTYSAYAIIAAPGDGSISISSAGKVDNAAVLAQIKQAAELRVDACAVEGIEPRYQARDAGAAGAVIGRTTIDTILWVGRYVQQAAACGLPCDLIYRTAERSCILPTKRNGLPPLPPGAPKHADGQMRAALIQRFARHDLRAGKGTRAKPDVFAGVTGDMWQAVAVGVTWLIQKGAL